MENNCKEKLENNFQSIHYMKLNNKPFCSIKNGMKTVELRLNDEKRKKVKVGDTIIFENIDNLEKISVLVLKIHKFDNFEKLYEKIDKTLIGYSSEEIALSSDMEKYYSIEQQKKYGVLGIEFRITKLNQNL